MRTAIDRFGRIVVPKPIRDRLHLDRGQEVEIEEHGGVIEIRPVPAEIEIITTPDGPVARRVSGTATVADDDVRETLESIRR